MFQSDKNYRFFMVGIDWQILVFLARFGYDSSNKKSMICTLFKLLMTRSIQDEIFHTFTKNNDKRKL